MPYIPANAMSSASIKSPPIRLGILGVPGVGKTWAALTFPNPIVLDLDNKLSGYVKAHPEHSFPIIPFWNRDYVVNELKVNNFKPQGSSVYKQDNKFPHNIRDAVTKWLVSEGPKLEEGQTLIMEPTPVLADNDKVAAVKAMSKCKDVNETDLENVEVLVRPFVVRS